MSLPRKGVSPLGWVGMRRELPWAATVLALVMAVVGCSSDDASDTGNAADTANSARQTASSPTGAGSDASGTSSDEDDGTSNARGAADGTNIEACRDGDCEILVTGPVTVPLDGTYLTEISLALDGSDSVSFTMEPAPGSSIGGGIGVGCAAGLTITAHGGGSTSACGDNALSVAPSQGMTLRATQGNGGVVVEIKTLR